MVSRALRAADQLLEDGIHARVLNMATLRPLDRDAIIAAAERRAHCDGRRALTNGGLGSAVAEVVTETKPVRVHRIGFPDTFAPTGSTSFLFEHFGLTAAAIRAAAVELVQKKA